MSKITFTVAMLTFIIICILIFHLPSEKQPHDQMLHDTQANCLPWTSSSWAKPDPNPNKEHTPERLHVEFQAGMNVLVYGHPDLADAQHLFERLRQLGVNSIAIVFPFVQAGWQADEVRTNPDITPTAEEIEQLIRLAHKEHFHVMLRPILDEQNIMSSDLWRGKIQPKNPEKWFQSYYQFLSTYAEIAESTGVEVLNIGTEFNSLEVPYDDLWLKLIEDVSQVYKGKLTYSFNWDRIPEIPNLKFVTRLDLIGIDAYFPLDAPHEASVSILEDAWKKWTDDVEKHLGHLPIVVTEAGMIPVTGAHQMPYAWLKSGKLDYQAQARYYEATYSVWRPMVKGIYWWCVTFDDVSQDDGSLQPIPYSPLNSITESTLQQLFQNSEIYPR